jgi:hypothetical protein
MILDGAGQVWAKSSIGNRPVSSAAQSSKRALPRPMKLRAHLGHRLGRAHLDKRCPTMTRNDYSHMCASEGHTGNWLVRSHMTRHSSNPSHGKGLPRVHQLITQVADVSGLSIGQNGPSELSAEVTLAGVAQWLGMYSRAAGGSTGVLWRPQCSRALQKR